MDMELFYKLAREYNLEFEDGEMTEDDIRYFSDTIPHLINLFINQIKNSKYGELIEYIDYEYDKEDNTYFIWHNGGGLEQNFEFNIFTGKLLLKIFFENDIYNICFGYDHEKTLLRDLDKMATTQNKIK